MEFILNFFQHLWAGIIADVSQVTPGQAVFVLANLFVMEVLLSIDNAAVLAAIVNELPDKADRAKALKWGVWGGIILRGACLLFAKYLMDFYFLKILGGLYLLYLAYGHFSKKGEEEEESAPGWADKLKALTGSFLSPIVQAIIVIEFVDLAFSLDNVFAAVAFSKSTVLVCTGVAIGMVSMRYVATKFSGILEAFPFLANITFAVIAVLGVKLALTGGMDYTADNIVKTVLNSHYTDLVFSIGILTMFVVPVVIARRRIAKNNAFAKDLLTSPCEENVTVNG